MFLLSVLLLLEKNIKLAIVDLSDSILTYIVLSNSLWTCCALTILHWKEEFVNHYHLDVVIFRKIFGLEFEFEVARANSTKIIR